MCYETVLRFCISLTETFCNLTDFVLINKYGKGGVVQISTVLGPVYHVCF